MMLHTQEAVLEYAYECAHASDEYIYEDEGETDEGYSAFFTCPYCREPASCVDGEWTCEGGC